MKNLYLFLIFTLLFPVCLIAQSVNDKWYFGDKAGLNFSANPPLVLLDSEMDTWEAVGVASDYNGDLLFYTDGVSIWNREHVIMQNGTGLTGDPSVQQTFIVHHPNDSSLFYVFTLPLASTTPNDIAYSIVDMSLGSIGTNSKPLGDVDPNNKNIPILDENGFPLVNSNISEAVTGTMHGDNQSYWILIPNGSQLYSYRVDGNGFNNSPETSNLMTPSFKYTGQIKISPNLPSNLGFPYTNFVAISLWNEPFGTVIQSFNNNTGELTTDFSFTVSPSDAWNLEFSSNGLLLYAGRISDGKVFVFDLGDPNNVVVREIFSPNPSRELGNIQRAVNDEIYLSYLGHDFISRIINPNSYANADVDLNNIYLLGRNCHFGLPQLIPPPLWGEYCTDALDLVSPELRNYFMYQTVDYIETYQNYMVDANQNIILSAGSYVEMLPNTYFKAGSTVLAMIEGCSIESEKNLTFETTKNYIDLGVDEEKHLKFYPNPVKDKLNIQTDKVVTNVKIYDFSGNLLLRSTPGTVSPIIDMVNFKPGIYFVEITIGNTIEIVKVIK